MAILLALDQWRAYLQYGEFHILMDQKSLSQLVEQQLHTPWQQKVFFKLLGLSYIIIYMKGTDNRAAMLFLAIQLVHVLLFRLPNQSGCLLSWSLMQRMPTLSRSLANYSLTLRLFLTSPSVMASYGTSLASRLVRILFSRLNSSLPYIPMWWAVTLASQSPFDVLSNSLLGKA
jgi:hypothetical protein